MSNVASLELCRELYELSGGPKSHSSWHNTEKAWAEVAIEHKPPSQPIWAYRVVKNDFQALNEFYPAYDAGYLLKALSKPHSYGHDVSLEYTHDQDPRWAAKIHYIPHTNHIETADTAENALCKLAIELFKAGVLDTQS